MRICVDMQSAVSQRAGIGRYTRNLVQHLAPLTAPDDLRLFYFDFKRRGVAFDLRGALPRAVHWCPGRLAQLAWKNLGWPPFDFFCADADLYHFPNFILPPMRKGKTVVTIHDMSFLRHPEFAEERNLVYMRAHMKDTVARADAIITDSRFSADETQDLLQVAGDRIFPIHLGVDDSFTAVPPGAVLPERFGIDRPYILTVGTVEPRKNIPFLVKVFERLADFPGLLVIAGMNGWKCGPILDSLAGSERAADIRQLGYVEDAHLPALYAGADLFACASIYEGFGFPPLEAMKSGVPVVSSAGGSLEEVLGDGASVVNSFDIDEWVSRCSEALFDGDTRRRLIAAGHRKADSYTWDETARRTMEVYRKTAE